MTGKAMPRWENELSLPVPNIIRVLVHPHPCMAGHYLGACLLEFTERSERQLECCDSNFTGRKCIVSENVRCRRGEMLLEY